MVASYGNKEAYGYHALEVLQSVLEKREGGETGIASIQSWGGDKMWQAMEAGEWPAELLEEALSEQPLFRRARKYAVKTAEFVEGHEADDELNEANKVVAAEKEDAAEAVGGVAALLADSNAVFPVMELVRSQCKEPLLYRVNYKDGTKGYVAQLDYGVSNWSYSLRLDDDELISAECGMDMGRPFKHFGTLVGFYRGYDYRWEAAFRNGTRLFLHIDDSLCT